MSKASPTITTAISPSVVTLGTFVSDRATLANGSSPTGTITFYLYGPNDNTCSLTPIFTSHTRVTGNGTYSSEGHTITSSGTYNWVASYDGDTDNNPVATSCGNEPFNVPLAEPTISTTASASVSLGNSIYDTAIFASGYNPTGTIIFRLYGPNDSTCTSIPILTSVVTVAGNGTYESDEFIPTDDGTYQWTVVYSGDSNNASINATCNEPNESVYVSPAMCIHSDMLVETKNGIKKISEIIAGDEIITNNGTYIQVIYNIKFGKTKEFYKFAKNSLGIDTPNQDFYVHGMHPIMYQHEETLPENLVGRIRGVEKVTLDEWVAVYSLCCKDRTVFKISGNLLVFTWSEEEWNDTSKRSNVIYSKL